MSDLRHYTVHFNDGSAPQSVIAKHYKKTPHTITFYDATNEESWSFEAKAVEGVTAGKRVDEC